MINYCHLIDLDYKGSRYIWLNKRFNDRNTSILERLDHFLAINDWFIQYLNAHVIHLPRTHSDYCPLLLTLFKDDSTLRKCLFKLKKMWKTHPDFINIVSQVWSNNPLLAKTVVTFEKESSV